MKTANEKIEQFRKRLILHPAFDTAKSELLEAIYGDKEHPIVAVNGPPGVGKTSLIRHVLSTVVSDESSAMEKDKEYIPAVAVRTPAPETRSFPWRDCYHTMIEGLFDPASRSGVHFRQYLTKARQREMGFEFPTEKYLGRGTKQTLYRHFLRILEHRKPKVIIMDEAHHFVFGVRNVGNRMALLANRIKSMADEMGETKLVLVGTYDMHECLEATSQGTRRLKIIDLGRYQFPDFHDASDPFLITLCTFDDVLSDDLHFNLIDHAEEIYRGCLGCVGLLKSWLEGCLEKAAGGKITLKILDECRMKERFLSQAMAEILRGEAYLAALDQSDQTLWQQFAPKASSAAVHANRPPQKHPFQAKPRAFRKGFNRGQ